MNSTTRILTFTLILFLFYISPFETSVFGQVADSLLTEDQVYGSDSIDNADSLQGKALEMLNDSVEAEKIVNESESVMMLDSLSHIPYFKNYYFTTDTSILNIYHFALGYIPNYNDSTYAARIELLNEQTPIELTYNKTIRNYIELYAVKKRELTSKVLGLKEIYFPIFEESLDKYNLPLEFKYLPVVESALNPTAGSRVGAKGLWQFMYYTGKLYGLKVTSVIDERFDPYKATDAACRHLKDLYAIYGDWSLVLAAYNSGAGNVNKAIRRAGGVKNYWAIWPFLPRETRGYVPAFIAVVYVMNYAQEHNLYPLNPGILYDGIDTVHVTQPLAFDQISEMLNIPLEEVKYLNPLYKASLIPAYDGKDYSLRLPKEYINAFIDNENALYNYKSKSGMEKEKILAEIKKASDRTVHIVHSGENLGLIARKYHVSINQLKQWNGLRSTLIRPGQRLVVFPSPNYTYNTSSSSSSHTSKTAHTSSSRNKDEKQYHIVKNGENLGLISKKYNCSVADLRKWNNLSGNNIYPKQKLLVYTGNKSGSANKTVYYTVKRGDTLWDIAEQYKGVSADDIKEMNHIRNSGRLKPGQKLKISLDG